MQEHTHTEGWQRGLRKDGWAQRTWLKSLVCVSRTKREKEGKRGKPPRAVIPYGTEANIHCSSSESYSSLKRKAAGSQQLLGSHTSSSLFRAVATIQSPVSNASVLSKQLPRGHGPRRVCGCYCGGCCSGGPSCWGGAGRGPGGLGTGTSWCCLCL